MNQIDIIKRTGDPFYCQSCWHDAELHTFKRKWKNKSRCNGWKPNKTFEERCDCQEFKTAKEAETEMNEIEYPEKIGNGEWRKTSSGASASDGKPFVEYSGNFLDIRNDDIQMYLVDDRDRFNDNLDMYLELGDLTIKIRDLEFYELPFSKGLDFRKPDDYGILASKICRAFGFEYFDWEASKQDEKHD